MSTITEENYVDRAEAVMNELFSKKDRNDRPIKPLTTSKIRNLLAMSADIYNEVMLLQTDRLTPEINARIEYLRVRFVYESGREPTVKDFVKEAGLLELLQSIKGSKKQYILFSHYMEALVAFRKFHGKDE